MRVLRIEVARIETHRIDYYACVRYQARKHTASARRAQMRRYHDDTRKSAVTDDRHGTLHLQRSFSSEPKPFEPSCTVSPSSFLLFARFARIRSACEQRMRRISIYRIDNALPSSDQLHLPQYTIGEESQNCKGNRSGFRKNNNYSKISSSSSPVTCQIALRSPIIPLTCGTSEY
jgi:hypothetical protein